LDLEKATARETRDEDFYPGDLLVALSRACGGLPECHL
jgi:hypothetical protein